ncbi:glycosyltransferase family 4 protein [Aliihoeflea sp. PC F10.4]
MRIVHAFRSPVGGIFRHVRDLAMAQHAAGHEVAIVCDSSTGGEHEDRLFQNVAPYLSLGVHRIAMQRQIGMGDLSAAIRTYRTISALKPDVLHGHGAKGGAYSRVFGSLIKRRNRSLVRLYSPHGGVLHYDRNSRSGRNYFFLERQLERFCDHILFVSQFERQTYIDKIGEPRAAESLVYNGVQEIEFEPVDTATDAADFLYIGMMRDLKGPDLFIEALAQARTRFPDVRAHMVGDGEGVPRYRARAAELGLDIKFHPAMPAREAFALARFMVVPSRAEAMPYIVLEALAAGRAMIASAVGGIPEILGKTSDALTRPTVVDLAEKMSQAMADPQWLPALMPPTDILRDRFSASAMAQRIESVYRKSV